MAELRLLDEASVFMGRYEVLRCLKTGGMGAVYEVRHLETRRRCALKVMLPELCQDTGMRGRFQQEATVTSELDSEHLVQVFDAGIDPRTQTPFMVMELLRGEDLEEYVARRGPLSAAETVLLLGQVAGALQKTHEASIVHRDLKPENLFLTTTQDGRPRIKILDFGIAKVMAHSAQSRRTSTLGTPLYMAPEQLEGQTKLLGAATDLYALSHIAYDLLVGEHYFTEESESAGSVFRLARDIMAGPQESARERARRRRGVELPVGFDAWFRKGTAHEPQKRFDAAVAMIDALALALETKSAPDQRLEVPVDLSGVVDAITGDADTLQQVAMHPAEEDPSRIPASEVPSDRTLVSGRGGKVVGGVRSTMDTLSADSVGRGKGRRGSVWIVAGVVGALGIASVVLVRRSSDDFTPGSSSSRDVSSGDVSFGREAEPASTPEVTAGPSIDSNGGAEVVPAAPSALTAASSVPIASASSPQVSPAPPKVLPWPAVGKPTPPPAEIDPARIRK